MECIKHLLCLGVGVPLAIGALVAMTDAPGQSGWKLISAARILENIKVLSSDEYEGRAPASKGEDLATAYIEDQFKKVGLTPGNPDGSYIQKVPMVGIKADPSAELVFTNNLSGKHEKLRYADDFVASTKRPQPEIRVE